MKKLPSVASQQTALVLTMEDERTRSPFKTHFKLWIQPGNFNVKGLAVAIHVTTLPNLNRQLRDPLIEDKAY